MAATRVRGGGAGPGDAELRQGGSYRARWMEVVGCEWRDFRAALDCGGELELAWVGREDSRGRGKGERKKTGRGKKGTVDCRGRGGWISDSPHCRLRKENKPSLQSFFSF